MSQYRFIELCAVDPASVALNYLQSQIAVLIDHEEESEAPLVGQCMQYLLSRPLSRDHDDFDMDNQGSIGDGTATSPFWEHRTRLFEELLQFFPREAILKQPAQELVDLVR